MDADQDNILYDIMIRFEWPAETYVTNPPESSSFWNLQWAQILKMSVKAPGLISRLPGVSWVRNRFGSFHRVLDQYLASLPSWRIELSGGGSSLAIVREENIEIRSNIDNFETIQSKVYVGSDPCPHWRRVAWSEDGTLLAYTSSSGLLSVFDITGTKIYTICKERTLMKDQYSSVSQNSIVSIFFGEKSDDSSALLLFVVTADGWIKGLSVRKKSVDDSFSCLLFKTHRPVISCAAFNQMQSLIYIGSSILKPFISCPDMYGSEAGVTIWRLTTDAPFVIQVDDRAADRRQPGYSLHVWSTMSFSRVLDGVISLSLSPDCSLVLALYQSGSLALWRAPSNQLLKSWSKEETSEFIRRTLQQPTGLGVSLDGEFAPRSAPTSSQPSDQKVKACQWWSNKAVILMTSGGTLLVSPIDRLRNMLGDSLEKFQTDSLLTRTVFDRFLVLEMETHDSFYDPTRRRRPGLQSHLESTETITDDQSGVWKNSTLLLKQTLYFVTDLERFRPPPAKSRYTTTMFRLVSFNSVTPLELYQRKIDAEEYGIALMLAHRYGLNTDWVHQRQWARSKGNVQAVSDYLAKVRDRSWVLDEVLRFVPEDVDSAHALLKFGLAITSLDVLKALQSDDEIPLLLMVSEQEDGDSSVQSSGDTTTQIMFDSLNTAQKKLCAFRRTFLQYSKRLKLYEELLGGTVESQKKYDHQFYASFRQQDLLECTLRYARSGDDSSVRVMFRYCQQDLIDDWLLILSNFPESLDVDQYSHLLPEVSVDGQSLVVPWTTAEDDAPDWCEQFECPLPLPSTTTQSGDSEKYQALYSRLPTLSKFRSIKCPELVVEWLIFRAEMIEAWSGLVSNSLHLLELGQDRGFQNLDGTIINFELLEILVYECILNISMADFKKMNHQQKLSRMLAKCDAASIVNAFTNRAYPMLSFLAKDDPEVATTLLSNQLTSMAQNDVQLLVAMLGSDIVQRVNWPGCSHLWRRIATRSLLLCGRHDQLDEIQKVVNFVHEKCPPCTDKDLVDDFTLCTDFLRCTTVLNQYGIQKSFLELRNIMSNTIMGTALMDEIFAQLKKRYVTPPKNIWSTLYENLSTLRSILIPDFTTETVQKYILSKMISHGSLDVLQDVFDFLTVSARPSSGPSPVFRISFEDSIDLVTNAAKDFFCSSSKQGDQYFQLSRLTLKLIQDPVPAISRLLNLLSACELLTELGSNIVPFQVCLCDDMKVLLVNVAKHRSAYRYHNKLLELAKLLHLCDGAEELQKGLVYTLCAESAIQDEQPDRAYFFCSTLVDMKYPDGWKVCRLFCEISTTVGITERKRLIGFALTHCPGDQLEPTLLLQNQMEIQAMEQVIHHPGASARSSSSITLVGTVFKSSWLHPLFSSTGIGPAHSVEDTPLFRFKYHPSVVMSDSSKDQSWVQTSAVGFMESCPEFRLFRLNKMRESLGATPAYDSEWMSQLIKEAFSEDTHLAIAFMLSLKEGMDLTYSMSGVIQDSALHLGCYLHSLKLCLKKEPYLQGDVCPLYYQDYPKVLHRALEHLNSTSISGSPLVDKACLEQYLILLSDLSRGKQLKKLATDISVTRFALDDQYKKETVTVLASSTEEAPFLASLAVADRCCVPRWQPTVQHISKLFLDTSLSSKQVHGMVTQAYVTENLTSDNTTALDHLWTKVYPLLNGRDHSRLLEFYTVLLTCYGPVTRVAQCSLTLEAAIKLLKNLRGSVRDLDFKELISSRNLMEVITPVLTDSNVHLLAKLLTKMTLEGWTVTRSDIFLAYIKNTLLSQPDTVHSQQAESSPWEKVYLERCNQLLDQLSADHLMDVAQLAFSPYVRSYVTAQSRLAVLTRIHQFVSQNSVGRSAARKSPREMPEYGSIADALNKLLSHMKSVCRLEEIGLGWSKKFPIAVLRLFDDSMGDEEKVRHILISMIEEELPLYLSQAVISMTSSYANSTITLGEVVKEVVQRISQQFDFRSGSFKRLSALVHMVKEHIASGGLDVTPDVVVSQLKPLFFSSSAESSLKASILVLLKEVFDLSSEDLNLLLCLQTDCIVSSLWSIKIEPSDVETDTSRCNLFWRLLEESSHEAQFRALGELLLHWPVLSEVENNEDNAAKNPWVRLWCLQVASLHDHTLLIQQYQQAVAMVTFGYQALTSLYQAMAGCCMWVGAFKFCLISGESRLVESMLGDLETVCIELGSTISKDKELLELIIYCGLVPRVCQSPLFRAVTEHALAAVRYQVVVPSSDSRFQLPLVDQITAQLEADDLWADAGCLLARVRGLHPSFLTISNALACYHSRPSFKLDSST